MEITVDHDSADMRVVMISLSETARLADVPRRTVQFWFDRGIIEPGEVEIARMLRPFEKMAVAIELIQILAEFFRDNVLGSKKKRAKDAEQIYGKVVEAARNGNPTYLIVQVTEKPGRYPPGEYGRYLPGVYACADHKELCRLLDHALDEHAALPNVVIDLTQAISRKLIAGKGVME